MGVPPAVLVGRLKPPLRLPWQALEGAGREGWAVRQGAERDGIAGRDVRAALGIDR